MRHERNEWDEHWHDHVWRADDFVGAASAYRHRDVRDWRSRVCGHVRFFLAAFAQHAEEPRLRALF